ncbi:hypothetical protein SCA6_009995 [Theobroma cacao]
MVDDFGSDVSKHSKMAGYGNESDAKRFKMAGYSVTNLKFKCIDLADGVQGRFLYAELLSLTGTARLSLLVKLNELQLCSCFLAGGYTCEVGRSFGVVFLERDWVYLQYLVRVLWVWISGYFVHDVLVLAFWALSWSLVIEEALTCHCAEVNPRGHEWLYTCLRDSISLFGVTHTLDPSFQSVVGFC